MNNETKLETEACGRCGGTGKFSYNQIDGDRCYGCGGTGSVYTKRGNAASKFLRSLREVPAETIKVGDLVQFPAGPFGSSFFFKVETIEADVLNGGNRFYIRGSHYKKGPAGLGAFPGMTVRKGFTKEQKEEQFQKALAYQSTLTKVGKHRK